MNVKFLNNWDKRQLQIARSVAVNNVFPVAKKWSKEEEKLATKISDWIMRDMIDDSITGHCPTCSCKLPAKPIDTKDKIIKKALNDKPF